MANIKTVLIYGGSFDPPHIGHLRLLEAAIKKLNPDRTYLLPVFRSPFKELPLTPFTERSRMIRLAVEKWLPRSQHSRIRVHPYEMLRGRTTYTYQSIAYFKKKHPGAGICLLLGSDCLAQFDSWRRHEEIAKNCRILVGRRPGSPVKAEKNYSFDFDVLPGWFPAISSSLLRKDIFSGGKIPGLVPPPVRSHILRKGLYGIKIREWLKKRVSPERFSHTLSVTKLSQELAAGCGADPGMAAVAALLHDAGRSLPVESLVRYVRKHRLRVAKRLNIVKNQPALLHSYASADIARRLFGVSNPRILSAIRLHTLGSEKMTALDKIIYTADISSEDRNFPKAREIRRLAFKNLDRALLLAARLKLQYVLATEKWIHPFGVELWNMLNQK